ncbi:MAG: TIGR00730 family Rossman fold protein [bacterium]|nr:TIGR00730 family Rossman fold protein [bacterium]
MKRICVFCGSKKGTNPQYEEWALTLGSWIAGAGHGLVFGGGSIGLMGVIADACLAEGGEVIGVIPTHLNNVEIGHPGVSRMIEVENMFDRKSIMLKYSDLFVVLPGGFGTLDELFEVITLAQLKQHDKPLYILNGDGLFDPLLQQINDLVVKGFISEKNLALFHIAKDMRHLTDMIKRDLSANS